MPPSPPEPGQYIHITFTREPKYQPDRRTRQNRGVLKPPLPDSRSQHAREISVDITETAQKVEETRKSKGINPSELLVLELNSINSEKSRKILEEYFKAWVVDERKEKVDKDDHYRFLVQFPTETSRQLLMGELHLYQTESDEIGVLHPGMRRDFFDALQQVRSPSREERIGVRLHSEGFPEAEAFYLDVDLWHPGDQDSVRKVLDDIRSMCASYDGQLTEEVRTSSLLLIKVYGSRQLAEALLELDWVARVDLPPKLSRAYSEIFGDVQSPEPMPTPLDDDPLVCVVDSGVVSGHPFLASWVVEERDFDTGENTPTDLNGHGTSVAGLVVYGDIANCLESNQWQPKVRICSAKVLCHDPVWGPVIPEQHRAEWLIEQAIRYFVKERQCQVFNLSIANPQEVYRGGRQFPWAEKLDELARELDVVIVQIAGNCEPPIPEGVSTREEFQKAVRKNLLDKEKQDQRICNPGTAALAITVGALARADALGDHLKTTGARLRDAFAGAPAHAPAPFTRVGWGLSYGGNNAAVKPDVVAYGGNWAIQTIAGGSPKWKPFIFLGEPTIQREDGGRFITARDGTSFACPHVAHAAAIAASSLETTIAQRPSANLVRALVGSATYSPPCPPDWLGNEEETLRLIGYGMCSVADLTASKKNRVRLIAMDEVELDKLHIYRVAIPEIFLTTKGKRGITVALAYDPPIRASRKEYLANTMWVEALHGLTTEEVEIYRAKNASPDVDMLPSGHEMDMRPPKTDVQWSTLQVRKKVWKVRPQLKKATGEAESAIHFVVGCQQRFPTGFDYKQRYGLVVLFWHESEQIELYQELRLRDRVRMKAARVRT